MAVLKEHPQDLLPPPIEIAKAAGREIMKVCGTSFNVEHKDDRSPLPEADRRSHEAIAEGFRNISDLPVLSEEGVDILAPMLMAEGKKITLLDDDVARTDLTKRFGFGREDRITNIIRVGFAASEIMKHDGVVVHALISPFVAGRDEVRSMVGDDKLRKGEVLE